MSQSTSGTSLTPAEISAAGTAVNAAGGTFFNSNSTGTLTPSVSGNGSPLISQDQSAFSQYVLGQTSGYPVTIGNLPGVAQSGSTTIGAALNDFMNMPPAELQQLEMQLWDAGYYIDGNGQPVNAQDIRFGVPGDPASWTAFTRALGAASSSGVSLTQLLQTRSGQGAGVNNALPSPVTGGGHTYNIDLSNPTTVKYLADSVVQAALGRNANASEVADITSKLQSQETQQGLAQESGAETQSKAAYQAGINQRNVAYESETNPNLGGPIPTGPFNSPQQWATALLSYMNLPVTTSNVAAVTAWVNATGNFNNGSYNPLGTSRPEGGSTTGSTGVQQFQNWAQGLEGTASMLMNGKYQGLISALQQGNGASAVQSDGTVKQELSSWSNGQIKSLTVDSQTTQAAAQAVASTSLPQTDPSGLPMGMSRNNANTLGAPPQNAVASTLQAGASNPAVGAYLTAGYQQQQAVANTLQAGATNPAVGAYLTAGYQASQAPGSVSPANVQQGQQPPNPGDTYINPVTVYTTTPASEQAQAYQEATTGANRIPYGANQYLNAYNAVLAMIKSGGPTQ